MPLTEDEWEKHFQSLTSDKLLDLLASSSLAHRTTVIRVLLDRGIEEKELNEEVKRRRARIEQTVQESQVREQNESILDKQVLRRKSRTKRWLLAVLLTDVLILLAGRTFPDATNGMVFAGCYCLFAWIAGLIGWTLYEKKVKKGIAQPRDLEFITHRGLLYWNMFINFIIAVSLGLIFLVVATLVPFLNELETIMVVIVGSISGAIVGYIMENP